MRPLHRHPHTPCSNPDADNHANQHALSYQDMPPNQDV
jgi:hypothetical protein